MTCRKLLAGWFGPSLECWWWQALCNCSVACEILVWCVPSHGCWLHQFCFRRFQLFFGDEWLQECSFCFGDLPCLVLMGRIWSKSIFGKWLRVKIINNTHVFCMMRCRVAVGRGSWDADETFWSGVCWHVRLMWCVCYFFTDVFCWRKLSVCILVYLLYLCNTFLLMLWGCLCGWEVTWWKFRKNLKMRPTNE